MAFRRAVCVRAYPRIKQCPHEQYTSNPMISRVTLNIYLCVGGTQPEGDHSSHNCGAEMFPFI